MSARQATPDSAVFPAAGGLIVALVALVFIASGISGGSDTSPGYSPEGRLSAEESQMMLTIEALSENLDADESPEVAMAWEDLRGDLESVSRDLENARFSVDVDGLIARVNTFREEFAAARGVSEAPGFWDQLSSHLEDLANHSQ